MAKKAKAAKSTKRATNAKVKASKTSARTGTRKSSSPKSSARPRKDWTDAELKSMKMMVKQNTPTGIIAMKLKRTVTSVYGKAAREGISLAPTNRSPRD